MAHFRNFFTILVSLSAALAVTDWVRADDDNAQEEIRAIRQRIGQLEAQMDQQEQAEARARIAVATTRQVEADADSRNPFFDSQSLQLSYNVDQGLRLTTRDESFVLHPWLQFQFRDVTTYRRNATTGNNDDIQNGLEVRRLKFAFEGNAFTPDLSYLFIWATDRHNGSINMEQAWVQYQFPDTPLAIRAGQFMDPLDHEQMSLARNLAATDRTLVDSTFANGEALVQGAYLSVTEPNTRTFVGFTDGLRSANTDFRDFPTNGADWGAVARFEYKVTGDWAIYRHLNAFVNQQPLLVFGAGADYTEAGHMGSLVHVVDAQAAGWPNGVLFYGAYLGRYTKDNTLQSFAGDTYDQTWRFQVSCLLNKQWEPYAQYEYIRFDPRTMQTGTNVYVHVVRVGTAYYIYGNHLKLQIDGSYLPNGSPVNDDGAGVLLNTGHNEFIVRAQMQLFM